ncbi:PucR family transcriptional regulator ligand-binding domain-containing protein [Glutamicibacter sp. PS]|uniref:PucR family transcriptional regulator n=1 Tax=Glutamicibacter sp. PS TaxID=3075634 RepID=UPI00283B1B81|nr:PucR family transcriptional regulator ligand-binding domain-containing protein [Glutamicibacter sp. PS]MDR4531961.1 PucR family transcriptional regulator ligand-binding domain-containing protein [Glutamicibacter sp. PS]
MGELRVRDVLALSEVESADPVILSGQAALGAEVRWVHMTEATDTIDLLVGGELVLTTLRNVPADEASVRQFVEGLRQAGAVGVMIEILPGTSERADDLARLLQRWGGGLEFPVVWLRRRVRFVRITEVIHQLLMAEQLRAVEFSRKVHEIYTELSLNEADERTIVSRTAQLLSAPVVLEDVSHRVLAHAGSDSPEDLLAQWTSRSRFVPYPERTGRSRGVERWLQTPVGATHRRWGRLVVPQQLDNDANASLVLERAGQTLTISRLAGRDEQELLFQARTSLLHELGQAHSLAESEVQVRAASLGLDQAEWYIPIVVAIGPGAELTPTRIQLRERGVLQALDRVAERMGAGALTGSFRAGLIAALWPVAELGQIPTQLQRLCRELDGESSTSIAVGVAEERRSISGCAHQLEEAAQVAQIVTALPTRSRPYYRFADLRLRGVLAAMGSDGRMRALVRAELGPLLESGDTEALELLERYLEHGGNKSALAKAGYLSRPTLYARLARLEERLGLSLQSAESRTSLHVALMWHRLHG